MKTMTTKKELRSIAKEYRKSLSPQEWVRKSAEICEYLKKQPEFQSADVILMYASLPDEIDTLTLLNDLLKENKKDIYCPVTCGDTMEFYQVNSLDDLKEGNFHVLEPEADNFKILVPKPEKRYCMILPGLMFDKSGNRLGYGKGFYDKYLAGLDKSLNMTTIGLCYEVLLQEQMVTEDTDQKVDFVVTEEVVFRNCD